MAMPTMGDPRFERTVIYVCVHSADGAMGLVINKALETVTFPELLVQLGIDVENPDDRIVIHAGGPVEPSRGFVLHSADYVQDSTLIVGDTVALTATLDILTAIAREKGPRKSLLALGYAGWGAGQLDQEIQDNGWLHIEADDELLFTTEPEVKWPMAVAKLGIDISLLSAEAGHA